jgi:predicted enzyme related to lactoylglutathione lyase
MSDQQTPAPGTVSWFDLTVDDASAVRDFYANVAGWTPSPMAMKEGYDDYVMMTPGGAAVAGVCHARGANAELPPQWLMYINVVDLDASLEACAAQGGSVISGPRSSGGTARYAVIRDPAGAAVALFQP